MKAIIYNSGYFLSEAKTMIKINFLTNIFSVFSTGLILFMLAMVISGGWISGEIVELIQQEAEISVYYGEDLEETEILQLVDNLKDIKGVREVAMVDENEAYDRMEKIMGKDAGVLAFFDQNPFSAFIEVKIDLETMDSIVEQMGSMREIEHVRDNRAVLDRLRNISDTGKVLGTLIVAAVGISTLVITAHIIRQGIYNNKEHINTLRLLGAPELFIVLPFILEGLLLTLGGGIIAAIMGTFALKYMYVQMTGPLPFIPLPPLDDLIQRMVILTLSLSIALGCIGSLFGVTTAKQD
ncbi:MAG: cell division protein FtsX [Bacillota bacterium]